MKSFTVWITLVETYDAEDVESAWEMALEDIADRKGMAISSDQVIEDDEEFAVKKGVGTWA
jgi:phenylalanyl-tRNA synthetase beta subunit